jgi:hypothetical protein
MKFVKSERGKFSFQIARWEREVLFQILALYPLVPVSHHKLSKSEDRAEDQKFLEESLDAQRKKSRRQVQAMLKAKSRFRQNKRGFRFSLTAEQMEWLLQVLNDLRVGSWLMIGSPAGREEMFAMLNANTAPYYWVMEVAAEFQMDLVKAKSA